jgi:hypothetical protein
MAQGNNSSETQQYIATAKLVCVHVTQPKAIPHNNGLEKIKRSTNTPVLRLFRARTAF